jgi:hypothetical protein
MMPPTEVSEAAAGWRRHCFCHWQIQIELMNQIRPPRASNYLVHGDTVSNPGLARLAVSDRVPGMHASRYCSMASLASRQCMLAHDKACQQASTCQQLNAHALATGESYSYLPCIPASLWDINTLLAHLPLAS